MAGKAGRFAAALVVLAGMVLAPSTASAGPTSVTPTSLRTVPNYGTWAWPVVKVYAPVSDHWAVDAAITEWNSAGADLTLTRTMTSCTGCIVIRRVTGPGEIPETAAAMAFLTITGSAITDCTVAVDGSMRHTHGLPGVTAHEIGHCLGLKHVKSWGSIMGRGVWILNAPRPVDLTRLVNLYGPATQ